MFVDATVAQDSAYTYDPSGNITAIADASAKSVFHANQQVTPGGAYVYDATYRLIEAAGREHIGQTAHVPAPASGNRRDHDFAGLAEFTAHPNDTEALRLYTERYEYDAADNLAVVRHIAGTGSWTRTYEYSAASALEPGKQNNRLMRTTVGNGANSVETYAYTNVDGHDVNGCMTAIGGMSFGWDVNDHLGSAGLGGGGTAYYAYDVSGRRVRKVIDDRDGVRRAETVYLGSYEIHRSFGADASTRESLHVMDDTRRVALIETQTAPAAQGPLVRYQLGDFLGSAAVEIDADAALISYEEYHPFGTSSFQAGRSAAEVSLKRYRFSGKERDEETGFTYHRARYCAPWLGRWVSADPARPRRRAESLQVRTQQPDPAERSEWDGSAAHRPVVPTSDADPDRRRSDGGVRELPAARRVLQ